MGRSGVNALDRYRVRSRTAFARMHARSGRRAYRQRLVELSGADYEASLTLIEITSFSAMLALCDRFEMLFCYCFATNHHQDNQPPFFGSFFALPCVSSLALPWVSPPPCFFVPWPSSFLRFSKATGSLGLIFKAS
jgi:hypothetical protein